MFCSAVQNLILNSMQNYGDGAEGLSMTLTKKPNISAVTAAAKADRHFVNALGRGLEVLACFRHGDRMLGNQDLARACGLPKSTVSRLTNTLTKLGYLVYVEDSAKYSLGIATLSLGSAMLARLDIRKLAHPRMQELAEFGQCMVSLGTRDRLSMLYIDVARGSGAVTLSLDMGARIQIATSAMGRAYMTAVTETERSEIMERVRELVPDDRWPEIKAGVDAGDERHSRVGRVLLVRRMAKGCQWHRRARAARRRSAADAHQLRRAGLHGFERLLAGEGAPQAHRAGQ